MNVVTFNFTLKGDNRGSLVAIEGNRDIPFEIKRVYYIFNVRDDYIRGLHAHRQLEQVMVCLRGSCKIRFDDGQNKIEAALTKVNEGILIEKMVWHEMFEFSEDCLLMVLANDHYNEKDYIRDYREFIKLLDAQGQSY